MQTINPTARLQVTLRLTRVNYGQAKVKLESNQCSVCTIQTDHVRFVKLDVVLTYLFKTMVDKNWRETDFYNVN